MNAKASYLAGLGRRHPNLAVLLLALLTVVATILLLSYSEAPMVLYENF